MDFNFEGYILINTVNVTLFYHTLSCLSDQPKQLGFVDSTVHNFFRSPFAPYVLINDTLWTTTICRLCEES